MQSLNWKELGYPYSEYDPSIRHSLELGDIYFIQGEHTRLIKIGWARDAIKRLKLFQTGSPDKLILLKTIVGKQVEEIAMHKKFQEFRVHGEWFTPSKELRQFIQEVQ